MMVNMMSMTANMMTMMATMMMMMMMMMTEEVLGALPGVWRPLLRR